MPVSKTIFCILILIGLTGSLFAEIELVSVSWNPAYCRSESCEKNLKKRLNAINRVDKVEINLAAGRADLWWKHDITFSFDPINRAMRRIGLNVKDDGVRLKVRGTIQQYGNRLALISAGDGTRFELLSHVIPSEGEYLPEHKRVTPILDKVNQEILLDASVKNQIVTIEGILYRHNYTPPFKILIDRIQKLSENPEPKGKKSLNTDFHSDI